MGRLPSAEGPVQGPRAAAARRASAVTTAGTWRGSLLAEALASGSLPSPAAVRGALGWCLPVFLQLQPRWQCPGLLGRAGF